MNNDYWDYLCHHGVKGQEWGVRNGPPYPLERSKKEARAYKRQLNKNDQSIADAKARYLWNANNAAANKRLADKRSGKLGDLNRREYEKQRARSQDALKDIEKGKKECERLLKELGDKGYETTIRQVVRTGHGNNKVTTASILGAAGMSAATSMVLPVGFGVARTANYEIAGNKYKVKA